MAALERYFGEIGADATRPTRVTIVIPGAGHHSSGHRAVLKPAVEQGLRARHRGLQLLEGVEHQGLVDLVLVAEVVVEGPHPHPGFAGDLVRVHALEARGAEAPGRRVEQLPAHHRGVAGRPPAAGGAAGGLRRGRFVGWCHEEPPGGAHPRLDDLDRSIKNKLHPTKPGMALRGGARPAALASPQASGTKLVVLPAVPRSAARKPVFELAGSWLPA